jgi:hypothetical protein
MLYTLVLALTATLAQAGGKPAVDRSGEALFRSMLQEIQEIKTYHATIIKSAREARRQDFYPDGTIELFRDGNKLRVEFNDMWGTSVTLVSDGKKIMDDPGSDPIAIRPIGKTLVDSSPALASQGASSSPWFYFMEGPALLDRIDKDRAIAVGAANSVVWDSSLFGKLTLAKISSSGNTHIWEIEFDNMAWQSQMHKSFPEWFDVPDADAKWRQTVVVTKRGGFSKQTFDARPPKGRAINDLTAPKKGPPPEL